MVWLLLLLLKCILAVVVLVCGLTYILFFYEEVNTSGLEKLKERLNGRVGPAVLKGIASSLPSQFAVILTYPLAFLKHFWFPRSPANPACPKPPVLLVHGLYHNASAWIAYRCWLKRAGFDNVYAYSYSSWKENIPNLADVLARKVDEITNLHPESKVVLIGHSLGGLLARRALSMPALHDKIAAVVTLGAPHQGSKLAAIGLGSLARSILPASPELAQIKEQEIPPNVPCLSLYSPIDNFVTPYQNNKLEPETTGWTEQETTTISHICFLFHKPTASQALNFINQAL